MEVDSKRPEKVGGLLKGAIGVDSALGEFMCVLAFPPSSPLRELRTDLSFLFLAHSRIEYRFQTPDSDSEPDDADISDWINEGRRTVNGQLNDEEEEQLNPMRTAVRLFPLLSFIF
jgi:hypothetical protein